MKIYLFGPTGMLGNYVRIVLSKIFKVKCITRNDFDILQDNWEKLSEILDKLEPGDVIVNCAGIIPQTTYSEEYRKYIRINSLFPHKLQHIVDKYNAKLIHITTDCVFDGKKGLPYDENDIHTETNIYGVSKSLGEPENSTVIRTSIIGEQLFNKKSLLEWVKSNKNGTIQGYDNHLWNGVTCLTLANIIKDIIHKKLFWKGIRHIHSPNIVSKYDLCCYISNEFNLNIKVNKSYGTEKINKSLTSIYKIDDDFEIPDILTQIIKLNNNKLY